MAVSKVIGPPLLNDTDDFDNWCREVKIWHSVTNLDKGKQGPALYLSLEGKARKACADLNIDILNSENGVKN